MDPMPLAAAGELAARSPTESLRGAISAYKRI